MVNAIVGANWGDEGKGKITDVYAANSDIVIRFQGGANAGHTIINEYGKFALHQLPSGVFHKHITNIIGNGVALDVPKFINEISTLKQQGVEPNVLVSDRTQLVMPYHVLLDTYEEERLKDKKFGSTKSGIAPFYSDKYAKLGIQISELFYEKQLKSKIEEKCYVKNILMKHLYNQPELDANEIFETLMKYRQMIEPYVTDTFEFIQNALENDKDILLEGQLGSLRDPDFGIYPYSTSSSTLAGYGTVGAGIPPHKINKIMAVVKAYSSAVGEGPFVSEIFEEDAAELRSRGGDAGEFGATTGRPRRMGWFDVVASKYGCKVQGATDIALTALDVLGYLDQIPVCIGYKIDGKIIDYFPNTNKLYQAKPVLEYLPGWNCDIRGITEFDTLPENAQKYVKFIEEAIGIPVTLVSNGPRRDEIIRR